VLPFLCWGAWATPGHPHARPHFVFAAPLLVADTPHAMHHALAHGADPAAAGNAPTTGQSLPSILIVSLFTLVFATPLARTFRLLMRRERVVFAPFPHSHPTTVPTPPPRFVLV
jgi:hypothetical protein